MKRDELPRQTDCPCGDGDTHQCEQYRGFTYSCMKGNGTVSPFKRPAPQTFNEIVSDIREDIESKVAVPATVSLASIELGLAPTGSQPQHVVFS